LKEIHGQTFFQSVDFNSILTENAIPPITPNSDYSKNFNPDYLKFEPELPHVDEYINPNVNIQVISAINLTVAPILRVVQTQVILLFKSMS